MITNIDMTNKNYQFFMNADVSRYMGEWIAICSQKIVSHGKDVEKVYNEAKEKHPDETTLITLIPRKESMIF